MPNPSEAYLVAQIQSATPNGLIVLLYDGLIRFSQEAEEKLQEATSNPSTFKIAAAAVQRATNILAELASSLRPEYAPELCTRLSGLYGFFTQELSRSLRDRDPAIIGKIIPLITELRNAWAEAEFLAPNQTIAATTVG